MKMFRVEVAGPMDPLLAFQAVDTAKSELVAQPFPKLSGGRIPLRAVSATERVGRILEGVQAGHSEDFC